MHAFDLARIQLLAVLLFYLIPSISAVKSQDFKTCSQSGFCRRGRALSARAKASASWKSPYSVDAASVSISSGQASFTADVKSSIYPDIKFGLEVRIHEDGVARVRMDEIGGLKKRYDEAASWALISDPRISEEVSWKVGQRDARAVYGDGGDASKKDIEVIVAFEPLKVSLLRNGKVQVELNGNGLLHMEHFRSKIETDSPSTEEANVTEEAAQIVMKVNPAAWFEGDEEDAWWDETWLSWTDSKPKGAPVLPYGYSVFMTYSFRSRVSLP
jgi:alpha 1,3-glucosidase